MGEAGKFEVRSTHINALMEEDIFTPWATTVQPYPPILLNKIRELRKEAVRQVMALAHAEFDRQASKLQAEGDTLIQ